MFPHAWFLGRAMASTLHSLLMLLPDLHRDETRGKDVLGEVDRIDEVEENDDLRPVHQVWSYEGCDCDCVDP